MKLSTRTRFLADDADQIMQLCDLLEAASGISMSAEIDAGTALAERAVVFAKRVKDLLTEPVTELHGILTVGEHTLHEKCADCHLFIDANNAHVPGRDNYAEYIHMSRGDEADEAIDGTHDARPSGQLATLEVWKRYGPVEMRERFTDYVPQEGDPQWDEQMRREQTLVVTKAVLLKVADATRYSVGVDEWDNGWFYSHHYFEVTRADGTVVQLEFESDNNTLPVEEQLLNQAVHDALTDLSSLDGPLGAGSQFTHDITDADAPPAFRR